MEIITSKVTLHSFPSTGMVSTNVFLEIILSLSSTTREVQLEIDPINVIKTRRDVQAVVISTLCLNQYMVASWSPNVMSL